MMTPPHKHKILHLINSFEAGGAEKLLSDFAFNFLEPDMELVLCYTKGNGSLLKGKEMRCAVYNVSDAGRFSPWTFWRIFRIILKERIELIHVHDAQSGIIARLLKRMTKVRSIVATRHMPKLIGNFPLLYRIEDKALNTYDRVIANSRSVLDYLLGHGLVDADKCSVVYNGIDFSAFHLITKRKPNKVKMIGTVARLHHYKGVDILINAFGKAKIKYPELMLHIAGDGPERKPLENLVENLSLTGSVIFHGSLHQSDSVVEFLSGLDIFVLPSRTEGFGISLVEAMSLGLPVIGSSADGIKEIVEDNVSGVLFNVGDESDLYEKLILLIENEGLRRTMAEIGKKFVTKRFSIINTVSATVGIYREIFR